MAVVVGGARRESGEAVRLPKQQQQARSSARFEPARGVRACRASSLASSGDGDEGSEDGQLRRRAENAREGRIFTRARRHCARPRADRLARSATLANGRIERDSGAMASSCEEEQSVERQGKEYEAEDEVVRAS